MPGRVANAYSSWNRVGMLKARLSVPTWSAQEEWSGSQYNAMFQIKVWAGCFDEITLERLKHLPTSTNSIQMSTELGGKKRLNLFVLSLKDAATCGPLQVTNLCTNDQIQQQDHSYIVPSAGAQAPPAAAAAAAAAAPAPPAARAPSTRPAAPSIQMSKFLQKIVLGTRSERGANEVRTRPLKCHKHCTAYPAARTH